MVDKTKDENGQNQKAVQDNAAAQYQFRRAVSSINELRDLKLIKMKPRIKDFTKEIRKAALTEEDIRGILSKPDRQSVADNVERILYDRLKNLSDNQLDRILISAKVKDAAPTTKETPKITPTPPMP